MKCISMVVRSLVLFAAFGLATAAQAKNTYWKGGSGNWSDPNMWDGGVPVNWDYVFMNPTGPNDAITNDIPNLIIQDLKSSTSDQPLRLYGEKLRINGGMYLENIAAKAEIHLEVQFTNVSGGYLRTWPAQSWTGNENNVIVVLEFFKPVSCLQTDGATRVPLVCNQQTTKYGAVIFHDIFMASSITHNYQEFVFRCYGPCDVTSLQLGYSCGLMLQLYTTENALGEVRLGQYVRHPFAMTAGAIPEDFVFRFREGTYDNNENESGRYRLRGDQTADRIHSPAPVKDGKFYNSDYIDVAAAGDRVSLTLKASQGDETWAELRKGLSLVYAPLGVFTQTFQGRVHRMDGTITVKGGEVVSAGTNSFPNVTAIEIDGGAFKVDTSAAKSLAAVTSLKVDNGSFTTTASASGSPFDSAALEVEIGASGQLVLAAGTGFFASRLCARGVWPKAGVYTGVGYGTDGVTEVDWISGAGQVTVVNAGITSWKGAVSGNWSDSANWTDGLPDATKTAAITAIGSAYSVTVSDAVQLNGGTVILGNGGTLRVPAGGSFVFTPQAATDKVRLLTGGLIAVEGGTCTLNVNGLGVSPLSQEGGKVEVSSGTFGPGTDGHGNATFRFGDGGADFSGTGVFAGNSDLFEGGSAGGGTNIYTVSDEATLGNLQTLRLGDAPGTAVMNWSTTAPFAGTGGSLGVGYNALVGYDRGLAVLNVSSAFAVGAMGMKIPGSSSLNQVPAGNIYGTLNILPGGSVTVEGEGASGTSWTSTQAMGIGIGYGMTTSAGFSARPYVGELNVSAAATLTSQYGDIIVGSGHGIGTLTVNGTAAFNLVDHASYRPFERSFVVGLCGGYGFCSVTNGGVLTAGCPAFVGGCSLGRFPQGAQFNGYGSLGKGNPGAIFWRARGAFAVADGTVELRGGLTVGTSGFGSVSVLGSRGSFSTASLELTTEKDPESDSDLKGSELRFVADEQGVKKISVAGAVTIDPAAKLVVDLTDLPAVTRKIPLITCASRSGDFGEVSVIGCDDPKVTVSWKGNCLAVRGEPKGLILICR